MAWVELIKKSNIHTINMIYYHNVFWPFLLVAGSLHDACINGDVKTVENLLKDNNLDIDAYDKITLGS